MAIVISVIHDAADIDVLREQTSTYGDFTYAYDDATIAFLKEHIADETSLYLIARDGQTFAGCCSIDAAWWEDGYGFLREIFIAPAYQTHGLGEQLMRRCIDHARDVGMHGVVTETAFENIRMRRLCEKCGFREWHNPEWQDGVTYKLTF